MQLFDGQKTSISEWQMFACAVMCVELYLVGFELQFSELGGFIDR